MRLGKRTPALWGEHAASLFRVQKSCTLNYIVPYSRKAQSLVTISISIWVSMAMEAKTDHLQGMDKIMERVVRHIYFFIGERGGVVVKELRYKLAGRGFDSRWCHWNFSVT